MVTTWPIRRRVLTLAGGAVGALALGGLAAVAFWPTSLAGLESHPQPTRSYDEAIARFVQFQAGEVNTVAPYGRSRLYTHGQRTDHVIVLVHGLTNVPEQYVQLAPLLFERGCNVLVPRMPHHGLIDRDTPDLRLLTARELAGYADQAVDVACGLGKRVTVAGISAGAVVCAWLAQNRADVDRAVLIASAFRTQRVPTLINLVAMNLFTRLPDLRVAITGGLAHGYTAHSTRGFGEVMRLGEAVRRAALAQKPAASSVVVVSNANDNVDNALTDELVERWRQRGMADIRTYEFAKELGFIHDIIDPAQKEQHTDYVYPILLDLMTQP